MNFEDIILSEISQVQKDKYGMILLTGGTQNRQIHTDKKCIRGYQGLGGEGNGKLLFNGYRVSVWDEEKVLEIDSGDGCMTL